jgi:DME family drug/metabolite transporter
MRPDRSYLAGCALVVLAGVVLSLGILCVRFATSSEPWQYLFWRALGFALALAVVMVWRDGALAIAQVGRLGRFAWLSVLSMTASQVCFITAIKAGNTAEMFFLMSLAPLMAATMAWPLLGERIGLNGFMAIAVALAGVALMSGIGVAMETGQAARTGKVASGEWLARLLALGTALSFALYSIATRGARSGDLDAALLGVGIATAIVGATVMMAIGLPFANRPLDVALALLHGGVILAVGLMLFARGSRVVPGVTLVMLAQTETVAAPLWTWLALGETASLAILGGGALILLAVVLQATDRTPKASAAPPPAVPPPTRS